MSSAGYTQLPPTYAATDNEISEAGPSAQPGDIPDDFKYGVTVNQSDLSIRHAFVRKVYTILTVQLLATTLVGGYMRYLDASSGFLLQHMWTIYVAMFGSIAALGVVYWKRHSHPTNIIALSVFTLLEAYTLGAVTALFPTTMVLQALLITLGLFVVLTVFTIQSKYDFSSLGPILFFALMGMLMVGLVQIFVPFSRTTDLIYSVFGAVIFCGYIL
ncbi:hypothetical protein FBU59_004531, partial [Linderina macrospora]